MRAKLSLSFKRIILQLYVYLVYPIAKLFLKYEILDNVDTLNKVKKESLSISRYGDGEYEILRRRGNGFQTADVNLAAKLEYVLRNPIKNHLICIPYSLLSLDGLRPSSKMIWKSFICRNLSVIIKNTHKEYIYGNSLCTRFYMPLADKSSAPQVALMLKSLWDGKCVCVVEGECTRLGVGNDLLSSCLDVKRIICPSKNAFSQYLTIRSVINEIIPKDTILLIALGMTATVLAYDMTMDGYQALDIGHVDVEYEWMRMGAMEKCALPGKSVNELGHNEVDDMVDGQYETQIIKRIHE